MIKETPILFSITMVQAVLAGQKTMTRRVIKPQPDSEGDGPVYMPNAPLEWTGEWYPWKWDTEKGENIAKHCPYGEPGDLLWVRESFRVNSWFPDDGEIDFRFEADGAVSELLLFDDDKIFNEYWVQSCDDLLKAGYNDEPNERFEDYDVKKLRLRPNIFMPKDIARIWLEVTGVRVERLQNISPGDACDEGINYWNIDPEAMEGGELQADFENYTWSEKKENDPNYEDWYSPTFANPVDSFRSLWQSINGPESWEANPWVWAVSFKVLSTTGKPGI